MGGRFPKTKLVAVSHRFLICTEDSSMMLFAKQAGGNDCESVLVTATPRALPLHWLEGFLNEQGEEVRGNLVQLRHCKNGKWTAPIPLVHDKDFSLNLRERDTNRIIERVLFDSNRISYARCVVIRKSPEDVTRVCVVNRTFGKTVLFRQVIKPASSWISLSSMASVCTRAPPREFEPYEEVKPQSRRAFGYDLFEEFSESTTTSSRLAVKIDTSEVGLWIKPGRTKKLAGRFEVCVKYEGNQTVVQISEAENSSSATRERASATMDTLQLCAYFAGLGVSFISSREGREVGYFAIQRVHVEFASGRKQRSEETAEWTFSKVSLEVGHAQVDCSDGTGKYPVVFNSVSSDAKRRKQRLTEEDDNEEEIILSERMRQWWSAAGSKEGKKERRSKNFLNLLCVSSSTRAETVFHKIKIRVKPMQVHLDGVFLAGMLSVLSPAEEGRVRWQQSADENADEENGVDAAAEAVGPFKRAFVTIPEKDSVFVEFAYFSSLQIVVTVHLVKAKKGKQNKND